MSKQCKVRQVLSVNGKQVPSKLFDGLIRYYNKDRSKAIYVYALVNTPTFKSSFTNLDTDENGEVTIEALQSVVNLDTIYEEPDNISVLERKIGAKDSQGNDILYDSIFNIIGSVNSFNMNNPNHTAIIYRRDGKYGIKIEEKDSNNSTIPQKQMFNSSLCNQLRALLNRAGFDIRVEENLKFSGVFDPLDMTKTVDGLRTVIRIAKGQEGEEAFPEEYSHLVIEGLRNDLFIKRLLNTISAETIVSVLGDKLDEYRRLYNDNFELLQREVAAHILQSHIVGNPIKITTPTTLVGRLWSKVKQMFSSISESEIDSAVEEANKGFAQLASASVSGAILPSLDLTNVNTPLYAVSNQTNKLEELTNRALEIANKRVIILQAKSKNFKLSPKEEKELKYLREYVDKKQYVKACVSFLDQSLDVIQKLNNSLKSKVPGTTLTTIRSNSRILREINDFKLGYWDIIRELKHMPTLVENGTIDMSMDDANHISSIAINIDYILGSINVNYEKIRANTLENFLKMFLPKEVLVTLGKNKGSQITVESIMEMAEHDINFFDTLISSMSDANDPMLSLVDKITKQAMYERDDVLKDVFDEIKIADKELRDAGYDSSFLIELDANGKKTGNWISDIDFNRYYKERAEFLEELKKQKKTEAEIKAAREKWEYEHTEEMINPYSKKSNPITEIIPRRDMYHSTALDGLSKAQREYYDKMIALKQKLQTYLPNRYSHTYRAVQIPQSFVEGLGASPIKTAKQFFQHMQDRFVRREFNMDYGEDIIPEMGRNIITDFSGKELQKLPVYYTGRLKDMDRLSTDVTSSMAAYASMAVNYGKMSEIIDTMELLKDFVNDREVQHTEGESPVYQIFHNAQKTFRRKYTHKGYESNIGRRIDDYYKSVFYGKKKKKEEIAIPGADSNIDLGQTADALKEYTGIIGLGLNPFSAISNVTIGKVQLWIEAFGKEFFNWGNLIKARGQYYQLLPSYMAELNSSTKSSKMGILIDEFDMLEEFYSNLSNTKYTGALRKLLDNFSVLFMQNMGEHYLHVATGFAILNNHKVKVGDEEMSIYDALDIDYTTTSTGDKVGGRVVFKDGTVLSDGTLAFTKKMEAEYEKLASKAKKTESDIKRLSELESIRQNTRNFINKTKAEINKVNQSLNGAFNETDKGAIHRAAIGRLVMQFRQWMPAHYYRRFAAPYYDAQLERYREGYYRTFGKFIINTIKDLRHAKFTLVTNWNSLNNTEKANMRRAFAEMSIFLTLAVIIRMIGPVTKNKDSTWHEKMLAYQLMRMKLEVGASMPFTPNFSQNIVTMLQSPAAAITSCNNLLSLLEFWNMNEELQSGRYKGYSKYTRDVIHATPLLGNIIKAYDLKEETYMFNIFNKQ